MYYTVFSYLTNLEALYARDFQDLVLRQEQVGGSKDISATLVTIKFFYNIIYYNRPLIKGINPTFLENVCKSALLIFSKFLLRIFRSLVPKELVSPVP
jgi:hypothetical protein